MPVKPLGNFHQYLTGIVLGQRGIFLPVVDLYALTNPQHAPWKVTSRVLYHDVPCRFCYKSACPQGHHRCLTEVPPSRVVNAALDLLQQNASEDPTTDCKCVLPAAE